MLTGNEYRSSLKDGRDVWILGEGRIEDVTTHPATRRMVDAYAEWYDRHVDPAWTETLLTPGKSDGDRRPLAFEVPGAIEQLRGLGRAISAVSFLTGGNMTHTPGYGALIALGLLDTVRAMDLFPVEIANAAAYREDLAHTGRFLTFSAGGAPIGFRYRADERERAAIRVIRECDDGLVISGKVGMHTSSPFAHDVFVSGAAKRRPDDEHFTWFIIPVGAPGVRVVARKIAARHPHPEVAPLSHRYDELDAQLWLEEVFVPFERVFTAESPLGAGPGGSGKSTNLVGWLLWHQHHGWLAKLEFSLGLALASLELMGARNNPAAVNQVVDLLIEVQTARTCMTAAECDPDTTDGGFLLPGQAHLASASLHSFRIRQQVTETLRRLPGSSLVMSPAPSDFEDAAIAAGLEDALGGGGYSARQRAALMNLIWDNVSSGLDGRESTYEMHANGGVPAWRTRLRSAFKDYNALANGVLKTLDVHIPEIDVSSIAAPPRQAAPGAPVSPSLPPPPEIETPSAQTQAGQWLGEGSRPPGNA